MSRRTTARPTPGMGVGFPPKEQARQIERLKQGRSVMDLVSEEARRLQRELGAGDRDKLD